MTALQLPTVFRRPDEGEALWVLGGLYTYRAVPKETGAYLLVEVEGPAGLATPTHVHDAEEEGFYVVSGTVRIAVGDRTVDASAGSFVMVPRGTPHAFVLASPDAKLLLLITPGSQHEQLFRAIGGPAPRREVPAAPGGPIDLPALAAVAAANGTTLVGPPPSDRPRA